MSLLAIDNNNSIYYEHNLPSREEAPTFVFVNALTGNTGAWEAVVAPGLRAAGFGTLSYNFRGQDNSLFSPDTELTPDLIVADLQHLVREIKPQRPILTGLSIGGLFAAQAVLAGTRVEGLVLLNTLRVIGPRISWINDAMHQLVKAGGVRLFLDGIFPLLVNEDFARSARPGQLLPEPYVPIEKGHGHLNLMSHAGEADWAIDYAQLTLPTLVITGLQDRVFLDTDVVERLYATLPDARREEWPDAGHLLPLERPERLAESLSRFGNEIEKIS
jgi:pimeloyl-ACP methyl ester carboxylesterase